MRLLIILLMFATITYGEIHAGDKTDTLIRITKHPANDYHVKWSPDGKTLAFTSDRSGEPKIWLCPAFGGEAVLLETTKSGDHHIG
ncbi:MAG: PD40 domain-containing protein [candidate division Zixibacteria bacterium]|nr:PD40 domain-containing protein [candidate division Zixibacteria bacterium]